MHASFSNAGISYRFDCNHNRQRFDENNKNNNNSNSNDDDDEAFGIGIANNRSNVYVSQFNSFNDDHYDNNDNNNERKYIDYDINHHNNNNNNRNDAKRRKSMDIKAIQTDDYNIDRSIYSHSSHNLQDYQRFVSKCRFFPQNDSIICATRYNGKFYVLSYDDENSRICDSKIINIGDLSPLTDFNINIRQKSNAYISTMSGKIYAINIEKDKELCIGKHDNSISSLCFIDDYNLLVSASWDHYLKLWDIRSNPKISSSSSLLSSSAAALEDIKLLLPSKIYAMHCTTNNLITIGLASNHVQYWDSRYLKHALLDIKLSNNKSKFFNQSKSSSNPTYDHLIDKNNHNNYSDSNYYIRCLKCFNDDQFGHLLGFSNGKCRVEYLDRTLSSSNDNDANNDNDDNLLGNKDNISVSNDDVVEMDVINKNKIGNEISESNSSDKYQKKERKYLIAIDSLKSYSFKCHRLKYKNINNNANNLNQKFMEKIYGINDISYNSIYHNFATAGSDGKIIIWDLMKKQKLAIIKPPIVQNPNNNNNYYINDNNNYDYNKNRKNNRNNNNFNDYNYHPKTEAPGIYSIDFSNDGSKIVACTNYVDFEKTKPIKGKYDYSSRFSDFSIFIHKFEPSKQFQDSIDEISQ